MQSQCLFNQLNGEKSKYYHEYCDHSYRILLIINSPIYNEWRHDVAYLTKTLNHAPTR